MPQCRQILYNLCGYNATLMKWRKKNISNHIVYNEIYYVAPCFEYCYCSIIFFFHIIAHYRHLIYFRRTNTAWVRARLCILQKMCTRLTAASDKVYQLLVHGWWFSLGTPASFTTKTGCHDIAEILLKVALKHQKSKIKSISDEQSEIYCRTYKISWNPVTLTCPDYDKKKKNHKELWFRS